MAENLHRAGFPLTVWNRSQDRAEAFATRTGCAVARTPRDLSDACDVVITMLADDESSAQVHSGSDGLFAGGAGCYVEMGTMSPAHIDWLAAEVPSASRVIDAPVSGATQAAKAAQLLIMVGGSEDEIAHLKPVFDVLGRKTICLGARGSGTVMKLAVNTLIHGLNQALAEAMSLTGAAGIAPETAFDVIEASAAAAPMLAYRRPLYLNEAANDVTFTVALARKDMEVAASLATRLGTSMPQGRVTLSQLGSAEAQGYGARDMAAMLAFIQETRA